MPLETRLEGEPAGLRSLADWLRNDLGGAADEAATDTFRQRSLLASGWDGEGGDAFHQRATALARSADELSTQAGGTATLLHTLAAALERAKEGLADVRDAAARAGLRVTGTLVHEPVAPARPPTVVDPTPAEAARIDAYNADVAAYDVLVTAWDKAVQDTEDHLDDWDAALETAVTTWRDHDDKLVGLTGDLMVGGISAALLLKLAPVLAGEAAESLALSQGLRAHADAMMRDGLFVGGDRGHYYDLLERSDAAKARAAQYAAMADEPKLPKGLTRGLGALGILTTAYGVHSDLQDGESTEQAVVSNVGGTLAGMGAGAAVGAGVGSVVPVAGTAVGAAVGAVVGAGVSIVASGAIDSMYEDGVENLGDVGEAIEDGAEELVDFGGDLVDAGGDLLDGIF